MKFFWTEYEMIFQDLNMEWNPGMEWKGECTQFRVTGIAQSMEPATLSQGLLSHCRSCSTKKEFEVYYLFVNNQLVQVKTTIVMSKHNQIRSDVTVYISCTCQDGAFPGTQQIQQQ